MRGNSTEQVSPRTEAVRRALRQVSDDAATADLLFLEHWETARGSDIAAMLRASQIRRANPALAAEIHAELTRR
jgi:hypothetical protein